MFEYHILKAGPGNKSIEITEVKVYWRKYNEVHIISQCFCYLVNVNKWWYLFLITVIIIIIIIIVIKYNYSSYHNYYYRI